MPQLKHKHIPIKNLPIKVVSSLQQGRMREMHLCSMPGIAHLRLNNPVFKDKVILTPNDADP